MSSKLPGVIAAANLPVSYEKAKTALAECERIDECKDWADKAAALAAYAVQSQDDTLFKLARRIKDRAVRRMGELIEAIPEARGANRNISSSDATKVSTRKEAAAAGISTGQATRAIRVYRVPREEFERQVESDNPPTVSALAKQGKRKPVSEAVKRAADRAVMMHEAKRKAEKNLSAPPDMPDMSEPPMDVKVRQCVAVVLGQHLSLNQLLRVAHELKCFAEEQIAKKLETEKPEAEPLQ
jgi:hypothetical protein